jgi:hypothetical protein
MADEENAGTVSGPSTKTVFPLLPARGAEYHDNANRLRSTLVTKLKQGLSKGRIRRVYSLFSPAC